MLIGDRRRVCMGIFLHVDRRQQGCRGPFSPRIPMAAAPSRQARTPGLGLTGWGPPPTSPQSFEPPRRRETFIGLLVTR